jgi:predicted phosphodiesterase
MKTILTILLLITFAIPNANASVGLIADIHAGKEKVRINSNGSKVYPKKGEATFKKALKIMKKKGVEFVLVLGDNTNSNSVKYANKIKKVARSSKMTVLFAKGNHERKVFKYISKEDYYVREINGKKIMVLDTNYKDFNSLGDISPTQKEWIYENIEGVDIISMHHPISEDCKVSSRYQWLDDLIKSNGVQKVYSGHLHYDYQCGVYRGIGALTRSGYVLEEL